MAKAKVKKLCANVSEEKKAQALTLAKAIVAIQEKIEQQIPIYEKMPLAQTVTVGTGEKMLRQNPAAQEFRATVREYSQALKDFYELTGKTGKDFGAETKVVKLVGNSKWKKQA